MIPAISQSGPQIGPLGGPPRGLQSAPLANLGTGQNGSGQIGSAPLLRLAGTPAASVLPTAVELVSVSKSFGGKMVLAPMNLSILEGEKVVLLGPSGCGKTTTLRLLAGLERPDPGGRIMIDGLDVTRTPPERRGVGLMFQSYALFPTLDVFGNVAYGLKIRKVPKRERQERVDGLLTMTRLTGFARRRVQELSGGQRQRVALARALSTEPRVLLLDEPLGALDAALRESVREELDELLSSLRITTVIVTHDQGEAMSLGDRIVVMREGRVEQAGPPRAVYHEPATAFVAGFVGGSNRLGGVLSGGWLSLPGGVSIPMPAAGPDGGLPPALDGGTAFGGRRVSVFFRPDQPRLAEVGPGRLKGRVVSSRFMGGATRLVVALDSSDRVKLELPGGHDIRAGLQVGLELSPDSLTLFDEASDNS
jgi:putative spermidine/putrescine transport system ATP-binding protein